MGSALGDACGVEKRQRGACSICTNRCPGKAIRCIQLSLALFGHRQRAYGYDWLLGLDRTGLQLVWALWAQCCGASRAIVACCLAATKPVRSGGTNEERVGRGAEDGHRDRALDRTRFLLKQALAAANKGLRETFAAGQTFPAGDVAAFNRWQHRNAACREFGESRRSNMPATSSATSSSPDEYCCAAHKAHRCMTAAR